MRMLLMSGWIQNYNKTNACYGDRDRRLFMLALRYKSYKN